MANVAVLELMDCLTEFLRGRRKVVIWYIKLRILLKLLNFFLF